MARPGYTAAMFRFGIVIAIVCAVLALSALLAMPRVPYQGPLDPSVARD